MIVSILHNPSDLIASKYERIEPKGVTCKCPFVRLDTDGYYWCCKSSRLQSVPEIHLDNSGVVRQNHYGPGRQPWDDIVDLGWAPEFAAGNVLKYLRRDKQREHSVDSAKWYHARLMELCHPAQSGSTTLYTYRAMRVRQELYKLLTEEEHAQLGWGE